MEYLTAPEPEEILVVEDTPASLQFLYNLLTENGFRVRPASSGPLALRSAAASLPDLILLDVKMPQMDGYEVCRRFKAMEQARNIPVIFISALVEAVDKVEGFRAGGVDYITKPFEPQEVLARIRIHLRLRELTDHLEQEVNQRTEELTQANRELRKQILERQRAERMLRKESEINQAAAELSRKLLSPVSINEISSLVLENVKRLTHSAFGYVGYIDSQTGYLVSPTLTRDVWDTCQVAGKEIVFDKFTGLWGWVLNHRESLFTNAAADDFRSSGTPPGHIPIHRFVSAPALIGETLVGQVAAANSDRDYTGHDLEVVERLANLYAIAIQRKRAEKELKAHRDRLEDLVKERTRELSLAKQQAEAANAAKSDFLARMSHEIRTPINVTIGLTNVVLKSQLSSEQRDNLKKVQTASRNLLEIINDILDFSKVEAGRLELESTFFALDDLLEQLVDLFGERAGEKDLELIISADRKVPQVLKGDPLRLSQILTNLIENAIKFTEQGEIVLGVEVDDSAEQGPDRVVLRFRVRDTGIGIASDALANLFEPFIQAGGYLTRRHEGTGLGLAICRRLVELMGGRIQAQSAPGKGSTFAFTVPFGKQATERCELRAPNDLRGLKTLVVDDSKWSRQMLGEILESFTFRAVTMESGEQALEELRRAAAAEPYQLVLLDWKMPDLDGLQTAEKIANDAVIGKAGKPPAIIMVSACGLELQGRSIPPFIEAHVLKPIKISQLFNTIMELFSKREALVVRKEPERETMLADRLAVLRGRLVLVVEDNALNRYVAVALLKDAGLVVEMAENGEQAVEKVVGSKEEYDAVLMDIQMPVMDGYEATRRIRDWERRKEAPVAALAKKVVIIALTAHALKGEKEKCLAAGMNDYLPKPLEEAQLHRVLLNWIAPSKADFSGIGFRPGVQDGS